MLYCLFSLLRATDFGVSLEDAHPFDKLQLAPTDSVWLVHLMTLRYAFSLKRLNENGSCIQKRFYLFCIIIFLTCFFAVSFGFHVELQSLEVVSYLSRICSRPFANLCIRSTIPGTHTIGQWFCAEVMTTTGCSIHRTLLSKTLTFPYRGCTNICRKTLQQCFFTAYTEADVIRQVTPSYLQQYSSAFLNMPHILA